MKLLIISVSVLATVIAIPVNDGSATEFKANSDAEVLPTLYNIESLPVELSRYARGAPDFYEEQEGHGKSAKHEVHITNVYPNAVPIDAGNGDFGIGSANGATGIGAANGVFGIGSAGGTQGFGGGLLGGLLTNILGGGGIGLGLGLGLSLG